MGEGDPAKRTQTGVMMGTPAYMSPEQCRGEGIDSTTDIYALGMILYEIFTGRLPFTGGFAELITHHLMTKPAPPSKFGPVPAALEKVILQCLEKDQKLRFQSAEALGKALDAALPGGAGTGAAAAAPAVSAPVVPAVPSPSASPPAAEQPDTLSPAPGRTFPDLTQLPARDRKPLMIGGAVAAVVLVAGLALVKGRMGGAPVAPPVEVNPPVTGVVAPVTAAGRIHVVVRGADSASVLVDGRLVAAGVREARVPDISPNQPHHLRVEAPGRPPFERSFTVTAGAEVDLDVTLQPAPAVKPPAPPPAPPAAPAVRTERPKKTAPAAATSSPAAGSKSRHRDGLVGDDIFDAPKPR
jgi:hypothetical protein